MWLATRRPLWNLSFPSHRHLLDRRRPLRRRWAARPRPEILEDRTLLSVDLVENSNDSGAGSLRATITNATAGDTIEFDLSPGHVTSPITLTTGVLEIAKNLNIQGPGGSLLTINGNANSAIFQVDATYDVTIAGLTLTNGSAAKGGAVSNSGTLSLSNCTISSSTATASGGGIENTSTGTLSATNCTISGKANGSSSAGGGIENDGRMTLNNCTVTTSDATLFGGGINNSISGTLAATNCTIASNSAATGGGIANAGSMYLANCTIASNTALNGGGIGNVMSGTASVANCTIAGNTVTGSGGGINNSSGASIVLGNTIIAGDNPSSPGPGPDIGGAITSVGYNLIGNTTGGTGFAATDLQNVNPLLGPLTNNGGPTATMALLPGSPAIDAGSNNLAIGPSGSPLMTDQRGFSRIANGIVDIGAFEVQIYMAYSTVDSGGGSLRTALLHANQAGGSVVIVTATGVIQLASALPTIASGVQILGPGANNLTVSGSGAYQVFNIASGVSVSMSGLSISDGMVSGTNGGGIANAGTLSLTNCAIANNSAVATMAGGGDGGGIANTGTLSLTDCTVAYNTATGIAGASSGSGGGIANAGTLSLVNSTVADNTAVGATAGSSGIGGGIANSGTLSALDSTIAGNSATGAAGALVGLGGGIANSGSATLGNTIVGTNTANGATPSGPDILGAVTSQGYNLIGNTSGASGFVAADLTNVNPVLGILQNNGGPTPTLAILPGSPAIAAGNVGLIPSGVTTDQRGVARTTSGKVDIGAFQSRGFTITLSSGSNQQGVVNSPFPLPLVVMVTSPFGDPVQGGLVTFTAPSTGASATFPSGNMAIIDAAGLTNLVASANKIAGSYSVSASANGAIPASVTLGLTNVAGPATQLVVHTQPASTAVAGQLFSPQPVVYEEDQYGNLVTTDTTTRVTASLHNSTAALQTVTVVGGVATFTGLSYTKAGSITLDFTSGTLTKATSNPIAIRAAAAVKFYINIIAPSGLFTGTPYTMIVLAVDAYGNQAGGYRGTVQFTSSKVATLPGLYIFTAADNGVHTFTNGVTFGQAGTVTITVYDTANPSVAGSLTVYVGPGAPVAVRVPSAKPKSRHRSRRAASIAGIHHTRVALGSPSSKVRRTIAIAEAKPAHSGADEIRPRLTPLAHSFTRRVSTSTKSSSSV
jgi:hypothetical protein